MRYRLLVGGLVLQLISPFVAALNLNTNFQPLPVPATAACALAYSTTIPNCVVADFQSPNTCSDACVAGLLSIASGVNADCAGLLAGDLTLISKVLNGLIIPSVCPRNVLKPSSTLKKSSTPTASATAATSQTSTSQFSSPVSSSTPASSSISATSALNSASAAASTPSSQSAIQQQTASSTSTTSDASAPTLVDQNGSRAGLSMKQQQLAAARDSRGGSPFDVIGYDKEGGTSKQQISGSLCAIAAFSWILIRLGR